MLLCACASAALATSPTVAAPLQHGAAGPITARVSDQPRPVEFVHLNGRRAPEPRPQTKNAPARQAPPAKPAGKSNPIDPAGGDEEVID